MKRTNLIHHRAAAFMTVVLTIYCIGKTSQTSWAAACGDAVAYWAFENNLLDSTGRGHTLTPSGANSFGPGLVGQAGNLGSSYSTLVSADFTDYAQINNDPWTWVGWVRRNGDVSASQGFLMYSLYENTDQGRFLDWNGSTLTTRSYKLSGGSRVALGSTNSFPLTQNTWYFIVFGFDGTNSFFEYNRGPKTWSSQGGAVGGNTTAGSIHLLNAAGAPVSWDEVGIYRRLLSEDELSYLYNNRAGRSFCQTTVSIAVLDDIAWEDAAAPGSPADLGRLRISRTGSTSSSLTVNYTTSGTAIHSPTMDYTLSSGCCSATIPAGSSHIDIDLYAWYDGSGDDPGETAILTLSPNVAYSIGSPSGTVYIYDCPTIPTVTIEAWDWAATENPADPGNPTDLGKFLISRTGDTTCPLVVYFTTGGTAINSPSMDYSLSMNPAIIPVGDSSVILDLYPWWDGVSDSGETAIMTLSEDVGYSIGEPSSDTVQIFDP